MRAQYPNVLWCHVANERKTRVITKRDGTKVTPRGAMLKKMGVRPGVSDVVIFEPRKGFHGLVVELKITPNKLTPAQAQFLQDMAERGYQANVVFNYVDNFIEVVDNYLV